MPKFLDEQGTQILWSKVKTITDNLNNNKINASEKGKPNGIAELDETGKVPTAQLPSYVDDVLEFQNKNYFPSTGVAGKIYIAQDTNITYRWSGSAYVEISSSLALGETSSTAYAGDKGKKLREDFDKHNANVENPHQVTATQLGLGNVDNTSDKDKPISTATQTALDNINLDLGKKLNTTDTISPTTHYKFVVENDGLKILLFAPSDSGSQIVRGTTGDIGQQQEPGVSWYQYYAELNIGVGYENVTISSYLGVTNSVSYDSTTGIAKCRLYSTRPQTPVTATVSYSVAQKDQMFIKLNNNGTLTTNNGIVADSAITKVELEEILK